eukprot:8542743-Pyramimonas_sp.AAC.1
MPAPEGEQQQGNDDDIPAAATTEERQCEDWEWEQWRRDWGASWDNWGASDWKWASWSSSSYMARSKDFGPPP